MEVGVGLGAAAGGEAHMGVYDTALPQFGSLQSPQYHVQGKLVDVPLSGESGRPHPGSGIVEEGKGRGRGGTGRAGRSFRRRIN